MIVKTLCTDSCYVFDLWLVWFSSTYVAGIWCFYYTFILCLSTLTAAWLSWNCYRIYLDSCPISLSQISGLLKILTFCFDLHFPVLLLKCLTWTVESAFKCFWHSTSSTAGFMSGEPEKVVKMSPLMLLCLPTGNGEKGPLFPLSIFNLLTL